MLVQVVVADSDLHLVDEHGTLFPGLGGPYALDPGLHGRVVLEMLLGARDALPLLWPKGRIGDTGRQHQAGQRGSEDLHGGAYITARVNSTVST